MKKVLITGKGSYIGTKVADWLRNKDYIVDVIDMINPEWRSMDFFGYDVVYHVAGIAHADITKVSQEEKKIYYKVNCDLAVDVAKKAMKSNVKQFIYMSSLLVYGDCGNDNLNNIKYITEETIPKPSNFYEDSKWQAEKNLLKLSNNDFKIAILRPPMIYGKGCRGNYNNLVSITKCVKIFPKFNNKRSVLYIGNLCEFIYLLIESGSGGIYWPQNKEQIRTSDFIEEIAQNHNKKIWVSDKLNWLVFLATTIPGKINRYGKKAFGSLVVDTNLSKAFDGKYQIYSFEESIKETESLKDL